MSRISFRTIRRVFWRILLVVGAAAVVFFVATPTGRYLVHGAGAEMWILRHRKPIDELVNDSTVNATTRAKLRLVQRARQFAVDALGLRAKDSFTAYTQLESDTLVLVLTVAYPDSLAIHTWWWPIVGRVPYKGFFDFDAARREQRKYEKDGYDTELRPSAAFSTLGWFNDPLLSSTLNADSTWLVNTVIHELLHNTVWIPGDVTFNESFASFVGNHGAQLFFRMQGDSAAIRQLQRDVPFDRAIGTFYERVYASLDSAFTSHPGRDQRAVRIEARDSVFARARRHLADDIAPEFGITDTTWAYRVRLSIASVLARRVYREDVSAFETLLAAAGGDLRSAITRIGTVAKAAPKGKAFDAVARAARELRDSTTSTGAPRLPRS